MSGGFRVCEFKSYLLAKYLISVNNCSCSHINFSTSISRTLATWRSSKKCNDHETSSFCVAFGSFGFFLTSTFPALKHHQPCTLLQSASQLQRSMGDFATTKLQKVLVCVLESSLISMDGATQIPISEFEARRWHNSTVSVWLVLSGLEIPILPTGHQTLHVGK